MAYYTDEQIFGPFTDDAVPRQIVVEANGGTVTVAALLTGATFITFDTISADGAELIAVAGTTIKITPAGGAVYNFGEGDT